MRGFSLTFRGLNIIVAIVPSPGAARHLLSAQGRREEQQRSKTNLNSETMYKTSNLK
jgi:hypothetical protein